MPRRFPRHCQAEHHHTRVAEGLLQEPQRLPSSRRAHPTSTTTRFPSQQIPTCPWTTPRSQPVGGTCWGWHRRWGKQHCPKRGTKQDLEDPGVAGHHPTAAEQGQVLGAGATTSPRCGEGGLMSALRCQQEPDCEVEPPRRQHRAKKCPFRLVWPP